MTGLKNNGIQFTDNAIEPNGVGPLDLTGKDLNNAWLYDWNGSDGHRWCAATRGPGLSWENGALQSKANGLGDPILSFLIENSLDLLSQPGEFYYDKSGGTLYYASRFPGGLEKQEIILPKVARLLSLQGGSEQSPAHNIQFSGLTFQGADRILSTKLIDWEDSSPAAYDAALYVKNAKNIVLKNCHILDTGMSGVTYDTGTEDSTITGCRIEHTGYHGINFRQGKNNLAQNCLIRYFAELTGHGDGVSIMKVAYPKKNEPEPADWPQATHTLSHLDIAYGARAGVAIRGVGDKIEYVKVHDCVQDSGDQGAIYLVDPAKDAAITQCTAFHNYCDLSNMDRPPTAIYNDRDAPGTVYTNVDAGDSQMFIFRHDPQKQGTLTFDNANWIIPNFRASGNENTYQPNPAFDRTKMEYDKIGLTADFPAEYNDLAAAPAMPLNLWAQIGNAALTLRWTQVDRATSYAVKRSATPGGPYTTVATIPVPATGWDTGSHYTDLNLTNGQAYYYTVTALNSAGESDPTPELKATPLPTGSNKLNGTPIGQGQNFAAAFDGDPKTNCETNDGWTGLDLGAPRVITEIRYTPRFDSTDTSSKMYHGEFQGSDSPDFATPTVLYQVVGTKGGAGSPVLIPQAIFNSQPFRYVRFIGEKNKTTVAEIEFYGYASQ